MFFFWDVQFVNECEFWYDYFDNFCEKMFMNGLRNGLFKNENVCGLFRDVDFKKEEVDMV